ncbi:MAG: THUMP domain-containing protein [Nanoarchaeota archaeon]
MKGLVITSRGIEDTASKDIKEIINANCKICDGCVVFDLNNLEDLCSLCYKCQSVDRVMYLIGDFEFENFFEDFRRFFDKIEFDGWISEHKKFKVECIKAAAYEISSVDVERESAGLILKKNKNKKVDAKSYDIIFLVYIVDNKCYIGVDFSGFELNKRDYKIYLHPNSLRGTIAYALVREGGFEERDVMLDPFSRDGVIPIEAALYANDCPVNYYKKDSFAFLKLKIGIQFEKFFSDIDGKIKKTKTSIFGYDHLFKYVDYSRKNAKIAGVEKQINFSRVELDWLDIKFGKGDVAKIITSLPISKSANLDKIYTEFFYQCEYILRKNGTLALISRLPEYTQKHAEKHNFIISKEKGVWSGSQLLKIMIFKRKNI